jgi:hypothetical protein
LGYLAGNRLVEGVGVASCSCLEGLEAYLGDLVASLEGHSFHLEVVAGEACSFQEGQVAFPYQEVEVAFPFQEVEEACPFREAEEALHHLIALHQEEGEVEVVSRPFLEEEEVEGAHPFPVEEEYLPAITDIASHIII